MKFGAVCPLAKMQLMAKREACAAFFMHERKNSVTYYRVGRHIFMVKSVGLGNGTISA